MRLQILLFLVGKQHLPRKANALGWQKPPPSLLVFLSLMIYDVMCIVALVVTINYLIPLVTLLFREINR